MLMAKIQERNVIIKKSIVERDDDEEEDESGSGSGGNLLLLNILEQASNWIIRYLIIPLLVI